MASTSPFTLTALNTLATFTEGANYCAISGDFAAATSRNGAACTMNLVTGEIKLFESHSSATHQCTISRNGRAVATASLDGTVKLWNSLRPDEVWKILISPGDDRAIGVALSRDGTTLVASFQSREKKKGTVIVWKMTHYNGSTDFEKLTGWTLNLDIFKGAVAVSDDGSVVANCARGRVYVVRVAGGNIPLKTWRVSGESHVAMSGDANRIAVADDTRLRLWEMSTDQEVDLAGYDRSFRPFCDISQDGGRVVAAMANYKFRVWCTESQTILADIAGFLDHTRGCAIHPDGNRIVLCSFDNTVRLIDLDADMAVATENQNNVVASIVHPGISDTASCMDELSAILSGVEENEGSDEDDDDREIDRDFVLANMEDAPAPPEENATGTSGVDAASVFADSLIVHNRKNVRNLLHIQAAEAIEQLFLRAELIKLEKYTIGFALVTVDHERSGTITEDKFIEAARLVGKSIRVANDDKWTKAFVRGAESKEGHVTIPQAVILILDTLDGEGPGHEKVVMTLEEVSNEETVRNHLVTLGAFLKTVSNLGLKP